MGKLTTSHNELVLCKGRILITDSVLWRCLSHEVKIDKAPYLHLNYMPTCYPFTRVHLSVIFISWGIWRTWILLPIQLQEKLWFRITNSWFSCTEYQSHQLLKTSAYCWNIVEYVRQPKMTSILSFILFKNF